MSTSKYHTVNAELREKVSAVAARIANKDRDAEDALVILLDPRDVQCQRLPGGEINRMNRRIKQSVMGDTPVDDEQSQLIMDDVITNLIVHLRGKEQGWTDILRYMRGAFESRYQSLLLKNARDVRSLQEIETAQLQQAGKVHPLADRFEEQVEAGVHGEALIAALEEISPRWADILKKRYMEKMPLAEIGDSLEPKVAKESVRSTEGAALHRARKLEADRENECVSNFKTRR